MLVLRHIWLIVTDVAHSLFGNPLIPQEELQIPIGGNIGMQHVEAVISTNSKHPVFTPPGSNIEGFTCHYPDMPGFSPCSTSIDRSCWLRNPHTGEEYNIQTDYETKSPRGINRYYALDVTDGIVNANGIDFKEAKLFNNSYSGPLIEACWGDQVIINVTNTLAHNGTSIHWHGIRQNQTMHMDGVNGITQCPIAPGNWFLYNWTATQYGSSWYHSHYSVQYADGLQAPITIHGPASFPYDEAIMPTTITDWANNSAFEALYNVPAESDILLGGIGNITRFTGGTVANTTEIPRGYEIWFEQAGLNPTTRAKRYLLRLINTAFDTTFIFSIDNHNFTVIEADFVPIQPYNTTSILVAIGQRYHIVVEALPVTNSSDPSANPIPSDHNYWIRTWVADGCGDAGEGSSWMNTGILRYDSSSIADPRTTAWNISSECSDTKYNQFEPVVPWTVGPPANGKVGEQFNIKTSNREGPYALSFFSLERPGTKTFNPFQTQYGNPTFLNLDNTGDEWPVGWVVIPENYTETDWVYLVLDGIRSFGPHPIHLHGHDFAIVQEVDNQTWNPSLFDPNTNNPPRRDVILLPAHGFAVIAFKTDNPGVWLMHCHIAFHASAGLSLQILERQKKANEIWPPGHSDALNQAHRLCAGWNTWSYDCKNYWPGNTGNLSHPNYPACTHAEVLQNDSGV